jgi:hypothetical protein
MKINTIPLSLGRSKGESMFDLSETGESPVTVVGNALQGKLDVLAHPDTLQRIISEINIVWASIFVIVGILCVLHGYRWHKILLVMLAAMMGVRAGTLLGDRVGSVEIASICLAVLAAVVAWPLMRYAVAIFGGLAGAFAGANAWTAMGYPPDDHHLGAIIGLIVIGMAAFMAFRLVVVLLTTIGGATLLVCGALAAMTQVESWRGGILNSLDDNPLIVPMVAASAAAFGIVFQIGGGLKGMSERADRADPTKAKAKAA